MRKKRIWPVGMVLGMLAMNIAVSIYLFTRNNVWGKGAGNRESGSEETHRNEEERN